MFYILNICQYYQSDISVLDIKLGFWIEKQMLAYNKS